MGSTNDLGRDKVEVEVANSNHRMSDVSIKMPLFGKLDICKICFY